MHQFRDKKQIAKRKSILRAIGIFVVIAFLALSGFLVWSGRFFTFVGKPIWKAENKTTEGISSIGYLARTKASVFAENENLKKENADLKGSMIDYQILKTENDDIKNMLGRIDPKHTFILAAILAKPNQSPYDTLIIDAGSDTGIVEGSEVYVSGEIPIGEVSKVYTDNALVMLYSNPGQTTEGVLNGSNAQVELIGRGGGNFEMTIPRDLSSENGTLVVSPHLVSEVIAVVDGVISTPTDPVKKVILHSPVNIQSLKWVEVKKE
jgi:rod shape-determining protein MreC